MTPYTASESFRRAPPSTLKPRPQTLNPKSYTPNKLGPQLIGHLELEARVAGVVEHLGEVVCQRQPKALGFSFCLRGRVV